MKRDNRASGKSCIDLPRVVRYTFITEHATVIFLATTVNPYPLSYQLHHSIDDSSSLRERNPSLYFSFFLQRYLWWYYVFRTKRCAIFQLTAVIFFAIIVNLCLLYVYVDYSTRKKLCRINSINQQQFKNNFVYLTTVLLTLKVSIFLAC